MSAPTMRDRWRQAWRFTIHDDRTDVAPTTPLLVGAVGLVIVAVLVALALLTPRWWYQVRTEPMIAQLADAGGLVVGDPVYVAGVPAGRVEDITLVDEHVDVHFRLDDDVALGATTTATVRLRTVLGKRYLSVRPDGPIDGGGERTIPLSRTGGTYSFDEVGAAVVDTAAGVDPQTMAELTATIEQVLPADSAELQRALTGISGAASLVADDADRIDRLLAVAGELAGAALEQERAMVDTAADVGTLVRVLVARRDALSGLVHQLTTLLERSAQVLTDRRGQIGELLEQVEQVTRVLADQADTVEAALTDLPPAVRKTVDATGNGPWVDVTAPAAVIPDTLLCAVGFMEDCS